ncbi:hypothetical protein [Psychrobacter urativorans]|uniref:DUF11 domain-containing protein n=1 Tax=Psychrobacter urativorans TaxID=45610 RepID=A0A0M4U5N0_9GAMM|nr:hypothetical protein [Psychrobacter urativorans]ALF59051.1 hypothetical protein AOC03_02470 [Psychrobacter urativorans]
MITLKTKTTQKIKATATLTLMASSLFIISAHAAPDLIIAPGATNSTTIVEQSANGEVAIITATPNSISMQNGMPYAVTQVTNIPRYTVRQNGALQSVNNPILVSQNNVISTGTTVTTLPLNTIPVTKQMTPVGVITTPVNTVAQALPITTNNTIAVTTTSLDTLQLKPVFSTPNVVSANTKVMKILKNREGVEFAVPANHIAAGDIIEYHTVYTNTTATPVNNINATVSLPNNVKLVSLNSPLPTLATINGNTYQTIGQVSTSTLIQEPYTGLQWNLVNLDANAAQTVVIRATVQ